MQYCTSFIDYHGSAAFVKTLTTYNSHGIEYRIQELEDDRTWKESLLLFVKCVAKIASRNFTPGNVKWEGRGGR